MLSNHSLSKNEHLLPIIFGHLFIILNISCSCSTPYPACLARPLLINKVARNKRSRPTLEFDCRILLAPAAIFAPDRVLGCSASTCWHECGNKTSCNTTPENREKIKNILSRTIHYEYEENRTILPLTKHSRLNVAKNTFELYLDDQSSQSNQAHVSIESLFSFTYPTHQSTKSDVHTSMRCSLMPPSYCDRELQDLKPATLIS